MKIIDKDKIVVAEQGG
jgi:hypothetical protein